MSMAFEASLMEGRAADILRAGDFSLETASDEEVLELYGVLHAVEARVASRLKAMRDRVIASVLAKGEQTSACSVRLGTPSGKVVVTTATAQKVNEPQVGLLLAQKGLAPELCFDRVERMVFNDKAFEKLVASGVVTADEVRSVVTTSTSHRISVSSF